MGFGGLPKQPRLSKEFLAFSSVFQVCSSVLIFLNRMYSYIAYYLYILLLNINNIHNND